MAVPWKDVINNMVAEDLPENGKPAPLMEQIKGVIRIKKFFVQKLTTQVYICTDIENEVKTETVFQSAEILGYMSPRDLNKLLREERENRATDA